MHIQNILMPITTSAAHKEVLEVTASLAVKYNANVHLLHAHQTAITVPAMDGSPITEPMDNIVQEETFLKGIAEVIRLKDVENVYHSLQQGEPANVILNYIDEHSIDLIVMKTKGRSGLDRLVLGSTTEEVLRNSDCPVLALREKHN